MTVARLLYLLKRARTDILTAVGCLCMRVMQPSKNNREKNSYSVGISQRNKGGSCEVETSRNIEVTSFCQCRFFDSFRWEVTECSYVPVGGAPIYYSSRKQKWANKSPEEAELFPLLDKLIKWV
jgi:hypothetical protein